VKKMSRYVGRRKPVCRNTKGAQTARISAAQKSKIQRKIAQKAARKKVAKATKLSGAPNAEYVRLSKFVRKRFDKHYLADFVKVYKKNPAKAKELVRMWCEF
jgi:hypothetical protein